MLFSVNPSYAITTTLPFLLHYTICRTKKAVFILKQQTKTSIQHVTVDKGRDFLHILYVCVKWSEVKTDFILSYSCFRSMFSEFEMHLFLTV